MRDFRKRVGLIHELRELTGAEKFLECGGNRFVVDQLLRHQGLDILQAHLLLDGPLHPNQADAEMVLYELADRPHPAITEMIDVIDGAVAVLELHEITNHFEDILFSKRALLQRHVELEPVV